MSISARFDIRALGANSSAASTRCLERGARGTGVETRARVFAVSRRRTRAWLVASAVLMLPIAAPCQSSSKAGDASEPLHEMLVTARKVPEDVLRVPMSVQALAGDFLDASDESSLYEIQFDVPGLVVANLGMFGAGIALRGITDEGGGSLAVAPHFNGVYLGQPGLALARMFDVERIEVLKGPQGTLYGRNATGGSINVFSRPAADELSAAAEGALGSFDTIRLQGHVNLPSERFAVRLAVAGSEGDGFIRNSVDDRTFAEEDYVGARISVQVEPTERLAIALTAQRVEDDGASGELWLPRKDLLVDPSDIWLTTVTLDNPYLSTMNEVLTAELSYEFDATTLKSISGYARNVTSALDDCAGVPELRGCIREVSPDSYEQRSQEFQFASRSNVSLDWIAGLFLLDADSLTNFRLSLLSPVPINDYSAISEETAYAAFGQATRRLGERWSVTGGLRLSHETARVTSSGTGSADYAVRTSAEDSWDDTSWRVGAEYAFAAGALFYASVATGFKSGGITQEILPSGELDSFDPEELTAYEAGINLRLPERPWTLRGSAFRYDFRDLQVRTFAVLADNFLAVIDNAAAARAYGIDVTSTTRLTERLTFSGAAVWMPKREFVEFTNALTGDTLSGNTLSRAPEWSVTASITFRRPVPGLGDFSARADYNYRSAFFFTKENNLAVAQESFVLLNLFLRLEARSEKWYVFGSARNLLDTEYFNQVFLQSSPGYPANYEAGFGWRF